MRPWDFIHTPVCEAELVNPFYPLYSEFRLRPRAVTSGVISAHGVEERQARSVRTRSYWSGVGCRGKAISSFHMVVRERPIDDGRVDITFTHLWLTDSRIGRCVSTFASLALARRCTYVCRRGLCWLPSIWGLQEISRHFPCHICPRSLRTRWSKLKTMMA